MQAVTKPFVMDARTKRICGLMEAANPEHRLGNELEAELQTFEISFVPGKVELTEDPELVLRETEDDVGVDPGIVVSRIRLLGTVNAFQGQEHLEFVRDVFMVSKRQVRRTECRQDDGGQYSRE